MGLGFILKLYHAHLPNPMRGREYNSYRDSLIAHKRKHLFCTCLANHILSRVNHARGAIAVIAMTHCTSNCVVIHNHNLIDI